ncbi:MAG: arsenate reductase ArsC [Pirellulaceae bacterium]|nr:arsenate reductase ArsC [Planctomycetales bacterium]
MLKVLFLCTGNSCRSQMAEGWARHLIADDVEAYSAGVATHGMNPYAMSVMAEAGVDIGGQYSKHVDELAEIPFDYVIAVCDHAAETCPTFRGDAQIIRHQFDDPPKLASSAATDEERLVHYRRVRDEIREFVAGLPNLLKDVG